MISTVVLIALLLILVIGWFVMLSKLLWAVRTFRQHTFLTDKSILSEQPSVSVCIPSRNETHAMTECLEKVIASTYPKFEIIVSDDHSHDNTPTLIKSFAHEGVRFVKTDQLPAGWLGKNHTLQHLANEASGSIILFLDVDTRIEPETIEELVAYMVNQSADMVSVLPRREDGWRFSTIFSPLRYFWELLFHSKTAPASSSNAWMIKKDVLASLEGFNNYRHAIQPETSIAADISRSGTYRFLIGTSMIGVNYEKKWRSQISTSVRLLYPLSGGRLIGGLLAMSGLVLLTLPLLYCLKGVMFGWGVEQWISLSIIGMYQILYGVYTFHVWKKGWLIGALLWPLIIVQETLAMIVSIERYIRGAVTWRGRPISIKPRQ